MTERMLSAAWRWAAIILVAASAILAWWQPRLALGVFAGGAWNLASLGCLGRLLQAWIGPSASQRRAVAWVIVKFPLLYLVAYLMVRSQAISLVGFGAGFGLVLTVMLGGLIYHAQRTPALSRTRHGR